jgi:ribosome-binding factor A
MVKPYSRADRIADSIREEVAGLLINGIKDPRVSGITITDVKVSADISIARVFFTASQDSNKKNILDGLNSAKGFIKKTIFKNLTMRHYPDIDFVYDEVFENGMKMGNLIRKIGNNNDER